MLLIGSSSAVHAQRTAPSQELLTDLAEAAHVIAGSVTGETYVRYSLDGHIETLHEIAVDNYLKGSLATDVVWVRTKGGTLDGVTEAMSHSVRLRSGEQGIFLLNPIDEVNTYVLHHGNAGKIIRQRDRSAGYAAIHYGSFDKYAAWRQLSEAIAEAVGAETRILELTVEKLLLTAATDKEFCVKLDNPVPDVQAKTVQFDVMAKTNVQGLKFGRAEILIDYPAGNLGEWIVDQGNVEKERSLMLLPIRLRWLIRLRSKST